MTTDKAGRSFHAVPFVPQATWQRRRAQRPYCRHRRATAGKPADASHCNVA